MTEKYPLHVTPKQAKLLTQWLSVVAQDAEPSDSYYSEVENLAEVGQQAAEIAGEHGAFDE